jgi:hypothetical protein
VAGDWIKMRGNLWDDPRVGRLCDLTESTEASVVGGLYWLWATADQHTEDGIMPGLSLRQIDRKTGIKGFGDALVSIGWLSDHPEGVRIIKFEEHNGASAKKRCQTAKRVAAFKAANGDETQGGDEGNASSVSDALPRGREEEEKRREEHHFVEREEDIPPPTPAGAVCLALKAEGIWPLNPSHPTLLVLLAAGATTAEFVDAAPKAKRKRDAFEYLLGVVKGRREDAAKAAQGLHQGPMPARAPPQSFGERETARKAARIKEMVGEALDHYDRTIIDMEQPNAALPALD